MAGRNGVFHGDASNRSSLIVTCDSINCNATLEWENGVYVYELEPVQPSLDDDAGDLKTLKAITGRSILTVAKSESRGMHQPEIIHGLFFANESGLVEIERGGQIIHKVEHEGVHTADVDQVSQTHDWTMDVQPQGSVIPFFPDCYPEDRITHSISLTIVMDVSAAGPPSEHRASKAKLMNQLSIGKSVLLDQLNIRLDVDRVIMGTENDPVPLSRVGSSCSSAIAEFNELGKWLRSKPQSSAFTLLVSNCFSGVIGIANLGSACGSSGYGSSHFNPLTIMHEFGHGLGMRHTFQNGVRTTGGIMDYGNGMYQGALQYHPINREEVCPFLTGLKRRNCEHFQPTSKNSNCGDGLLGTNEACECLDGKTSCGRCVECKISPGSAVECSSSDFVYRSNSTPNKVLVVDPSMLKDPKCCPKNQYAQPKTLCGPGNQDACGDDGNCVPVCRRWLLQTTKNCGFDASG